MKYGAGAYFYVKGICEAPGWDAKRWAQRAAFGPNGKSRREYERYAVLAAPIQLESPWGPPRTDSKARIPRCQSGCN
jgi:hypothetical protein